MPQWLPGQWDGRTAETDAAMKAKVLSYSRSRGAFAGLELKGATLNQDDDANKALYGRRSMRWKFSRARSRLLRQASPLSMS